MDRYIAPAVIIWFTAQWFGSARSIALLTPLEKKERATLEGGALGTVHWRLRSKCNSLVWSRAPSNGYFAARSSPEHCRSDNRSCFGLGPQT